MKLTLAQKILWVAAALALVAFAALVWTGGLRTSSSEESAQQAFRPEFRLEDAAGRPVTSEDFRGRYRLVNETQAPIEQVHLRLMDMNLELLSADLPGARLQRYDERIVDLS